MHPPHIPTAYSSTILEKETSSHASGETVASASANSHIQHLRWETGNYECILPKKESHTDIL